MRLSSGPRRVVEQSQQRRICPGYRGERSGHHRTDPEGQRAPLADHLGRDESRHRGARWRFISGETLRHTSSHPGTESALRRGSILTHTGPNTPLTVVVYQARHLHTIKKIKYDSLNIDYLSSSCVLTPQQDVFDYWSIKAHTSVFILRSCSDLRINTPAS